MAYINFVSCQTDTMYADVNNFLDIDGHSELSREFIAIRDSKADGSFLVHHFLCLFSRQRRKICFAGLQQSLSHYNSLSLKSGVNMDMIRDSGHLAFIEGLKHIGDSIVSQSEIDGKCQCVSNDSVVWANSLVQNLSLKQLFLHIKEVINSLCDNGVKPVIIIDDLSVLLSLGVSTTEIITFLHYMKSEFVHKRSGSVVVHLHGDQSSGDEEETLTWKTMCHMSTLQLQVTGLPSGYCKEVQGEILLTRRKGGDSRSEEKRKTLSKKIQYRTTDKSVVCFAVGMSSVVL